MPYNTFLPFHSPPEIKHSALRMIRKHENEKGLLISRYSLIMRHGPAIDNMRYKKLTEKKEMTIGILQILGPREKLQSRTDDIEAGRDEEVDLAVVRASQIIV